MYLQLFLTILAMHYSNGITLDDYCKHNSSNSPCYYRCVRDKRCGDTGTGFKLLEDAEREVIIKLHNEFRQQIGEGALTNVPKGTDLSAISYDKEVEFLASCYIKQCSDAHDYARVDLNGVDMGQNIRGETKPKSETWNIIPFLERGVNTWSDEYKVLTASNKKMFSSYKMVKGTGHFAAMAWGSVAYVGCAKIDYVSGSKIGYLLICNYKPKPNIAGREMYSTSKDCADKNDVYSSLCGKIRPLSDDTYVPPMDLNSAIVFKPAYFVLFTFSSLIIYLR